MRRRVSQVLVADFDGSFAVRTAEALRAAGSTPKIIAYEDLTPSVITREHPLAVILTACGLGKHYAVSPEIFSMNVPFLGICNGAQIVATVACGGSVVPLERCEDAVVELRRHGPSVLLSGTPWIQQVLMYHEYAVASLSSTSCRITASTDLSMIAAFECIGSPLFGVQFHPEALETAYGTRMLRRFIRFSYVYRVAPVSWSRRAGRFM